MLCVMCVSQTPSTASKQGQGRGVRRYRYVAITGRVPWNDGESLRYGQEVDALRWHRSKVLVQFDDGHVALTCGRCLRRL